MVEWVRRVLPAHPHRTFGRPRLLYARTVERVAESSEEGDPAREGPQGPGALQQRMGKGTGVFDRLGRGQLLHRTPAQRARVRLVARALRRVHARNRMPGV